MLLGFVCLFIGILGFVFFSLVLFSAAFPKHIPAYSWERQHSRNRQGNPVWEWNFATSDPYMDNLVYCRFPSPAPPACPELPWDTCSFHSPWNKFLSSQPASHSKKFTLVPRREKRINVLITTSLCGFSVVFLCDLGKVRGLSHLKVHMGQKLSAWFPGISKINNVGMWKVIY